MKLNERQQFIINFAAQNKTFQTKDVFAVVRKEFDVERLTIVRDLSLLEKELILKKSGKGRAVYYEPTLQYSLLRPIDVDNYFSQEIEKRTVRIDFNHDIFGAMTRIFTDDELKYLGQLNQIYKKKITKLPMDAFKKEVERMNIDFSWKSSKIEGNTYSLLETEQLLKNHREAAGHAKEEAMMILNHKKALEYIRENEELFKKMSLRKVEDIHNLLTDSLNITKGLRNILVRITGTRYVPLDNPFKIKEAVQNTCSLSNKIESPFESAVIMMLLIAYIQPFVDGNKRTSRISGNAVLLAHNCCPLSYRSMDDLEYKKAVLLFYEQNNVSYFKEIFIEQFEFAVKEYFL